MSALILLSVLLLVYSNGANDNFKGVATLFGSGTTNYPKALAWATVTTFAGAMLALVLAQDLVSTFKGKGLVPDAVTMAPAFLFAVSFGCALTILLATRLGLPVSTTHGLTGALVGARLLATGGDIKWSTLGSSFLLPLVASPLLALLLTLVIYPTFRFVRRTLGVTRQSCVWVGTVFEPVSCQPDGTLALARTGLALHAGQSSECVERYRGRMLGMEAGAVLDALHYLSAGAVGFARGVNDAPKLLALLLAAEVLGPNIGLLVISIVMVLGGLFNARRVAETMSQKITRMNPGQGFTANLITSLLVTLASRFGLPVSTTHVSVGALFGIGIVNGTARARMIVTILLAWVTTLPLAAVLAGATYWTIRSTA
jgi:inorganic phosphate transporter, PiT family